MTEIILTSSVLILLLVLLRQALRGRIRPCVQYALWLLVAARLLIPGTFFHAPVSVLGAAEELQATFHQTISEPDNLREPVINDIMNQLPQPSQAAHPDGDTVITYQPAAPAVTQRVYNWPHIIWKTGIAVVGGAMAVSNLVFCLRLRKGRKRLTLPAAPWSGKLPVYEAEGLSSPCLFGLFRPAIYLNEAVMDAEHPEHILAHEYAHYCHGDHVWAVLRCVCLAVHWYNPLVWWAAALSRRDCELACDEAALRRLGDEARIDYGHTLLGMVSKGRNPSALLRTATTMTAGKRAMKERIALIVRRPRMRKITMVFLALVVCGAVAVTFGGKAVAAETEPEPVSDMPAAVTISQVFSSQSGDTSYITDPDEVARLWELYQSFEYEGSYDPTGMRGWDILVQFQFGDEPNDDTDVHFILAEHGVHTQDGEDLLLKNIDGIYAEFLRLSRSAPITPSDTALPSTDEVMMENARSIVEQMHSGADVSEWLPLMNYMDWGHLRQAAVEAGTDEVDGSGAAVEILSAIDRYAERQSGSMSMAEYLYVLSATAGLDGAVSEGYAYTIHRMYIANPSRFAYVVLEQLPEEQRNAVLDLFLSEWYYDQVSSWDLPTREEAIAQLEADLAVSIFATPSDMTLRSAGSTFQFKLANVSGIYALTYTSSDVSVAEVDGNGIVTAVGPGEAVISAHYEGAGGPLDFECRVRCEWTADSTDELEQNVPPEDIAQYTEMIMGWGRAVGPGIGTAEAVPDQELIYDDLTEDGLHNAVVHSLEQYARNNIFTSSLGDPSDRLVLDHINLEEEPRLTEGQTELTVDYHYVCKATLELPNGQPYTQTFEGPVRSTTFTVASQINTMGSMLAGGATGNLPWTTGNLSDLSSEITNEWQRGFFGFVFALPAMPDQTLDDTGDNLEAARAMLRSYYQDYVAENGANHYNDRFNRIIFEGATTESTATEIKIEVSYQVECLRDRAYEGKSYTLTPQPGDHLKTIFTFRKTSDTADRDSEAAARFDQWFQGYMDGVSAAPDGAVTYDSTEAGAALYDSVNKYLYSYASDYFTGDFAANCYDYDIQLSFGVPHEVTQPQLTVSYSITVLAAVELPSGELHSLRLTSRELTTTLTVTDTAG